MNMKELRTKLTEAKNPQRVSYENIRHKLDDIVIIGLCTIICGGEDYNDMEAFGYEREEWLRWIPRFCSIFYSTKSKCCCRAQNLTKLTTVKFQAKEFKTSTLLHLLSVLESF